MNALCRSQRPVRVVLEATGIYFLDLACELAAAGIAVMVVNPKTVLGSTERTLVRASRRASDKTFVSTRYIREPRLGRCHTTEN